MNANFVAELVAPIEQLAAVLREGSTNTYSLTGTRYNPAKPPRQIVVEGIGLLVRSADGFYRPVGNRL